MSGRTPIGRLIDRYKITRKSGLLIPTAGLQIHAT